MTSELVVQPWLREFEAQGEHELLSFYVEAYWLPILGPTPVAALRLFGRQFQRAPEGFAMPLQEASRRCGVGTREGKASPLMRALARLQQFGFARMEGSASQVIVSVRLRLPSLLDRNVRSLPAVMVNEHDRFWRGVL